MIRFLLFALYCTLSIEVRAELRELEIRGLPNSAKADKEGFSMVLVDFASDLLLVQGLAAVPDSFGTIDSAVLIVTDPAGKRLSRAVLAPQRIDDKYINFEFDLRRDLLEKSVLLVTHRDKENLYVAKFILGSFHVRSAKK